MSASRRISSALTVVCIALSVLASAALAAGPATVTVRVEGLTETKLPPTQVTTTAEPVVKDGKDACPGTSALGALQLATGGDWEGPWNDEFKQYEIYSIEGESHVFEAGAPANYYWSFWLDEKEATTGACEAELQPGDRLLFFPACYGEACPPPSLPLGIEAPASADVGEPVSVTVKKYAASGAASPVEGATVTGGAAGASTESKGHATITFSQSGEATVRVTAPEAVRTEADICVHDGDDGTCGTTAPAAPSITQTPVSGGDILPAAPAGPYAPAPHTGPYALVAEATDIREGHRYSREDAPRVLSGRVLAGASVTSISLRLRRTYRGRCWAYDGARERLLRVRCRQGSFFQIASGGDSFSYLLPSRLPPGRYVLDVEATDAAGNHTTLARGTSRIVFYVDR